VYLPDFAVFLLRRIRNLFENIERFNTESKSVFLDSWDLVAEEDPWSLYQVYHFMDDVQIK
jgi:hypothetical protein